MSAEKTLRDEFAMEAMHLEETPEWGFGDVAAARRAAWASNCYKLADAMLKARAASKTKDQ
ncbi:hypothetical protein [Pseudomonas sp.]|uniref:hypothetical protein n=1 Tax=Pseudomonas sp. TaxID=306 RepID=UPI003FD8BE00